MPAWQMLQKSLKRQILAFMNKIVLKTMQNEKLTTIFKKNDTGINYYNPFLVYCRELAPGTVSLTGDRAQGDDRKHDSHYN